MNQTQQFLFWLNKINQITYQCLRDKLVQMINKIIKFGKNKKVYWLKNRKKERKVKKENWMIKMQKQGQICAEY